MATAENWFAMLEAESVLLRSRGADWLAEIRGEFWFGEVRGEEGS